MIKVVLKNNIIGKLLNHLIVFFINVLIVRLIGINKSGSYFNELYVINFIAFMFSIGLDYSAIAWISKYKNVEHTIHTILLKHGIFFSIFLIFFFYGCFFFNRQILNQPVILISLFCVGNLLIILFQGLLTAYKSFNTQNIILLTTNFIFLFFLIVLKTFNSQDLNKSIFVFTGYAILFFLQGLLMMIFSFKRKTLVNYNDFKLSPFYKNGIIMMFSSIIYLCFIRIDNFFVEKYTNPVTLSNYVQCGKIGQYFIYIPSIITSTLLPYISSQEVAKDYDSWKKIFNPFLKILIIASIILLLLGKYLYPFLFGSEFTEMNTYMVILIPGFMGLSLLTLFNSIYIGKGNIIKILIGDAIGLTLVFSLDVFFIPNNGAIAAAIISSTAYMIVAFYLWYNLKNQFE
jgi:O-antigen/teichoic acid export membrane protein